MLKLALIGKSISHSRSQEVYETLLKRKIDYTLIDCKSSSEIPSVEKLFSKYSGVSITSPYKDHFLNQVEVSDNIGSLGAINCLKQKDGNYFGTNTDYLAMQDIITELSKESIPFVLMGSGAMARVCTQIFSEFQIDFVQYSRKNNGDLTKLDLSDSGRVIVINSCARNFVFGGKLHNGSLFYDLNYNFLPHQEYFYESSIQYKDGMALLYSQGKYALKFWELTSSIR